MAGRFGYEIRDADNKLHKAVGGIATREQADALAEKKRDEIKRLGWRMSVYVTEQHQVSGRKKR